MTKLFGPDRDQVGWDDMAWVVWISSMDDLHEVDTLEEGMALAHDFNAGFANEWMNSTSEHDPVMYAVVLHYGYAWSRSAKSSSCGNAGCVPCRAKTVG